jgi:hypothetical protein
MDSRSSILTKSFIDLILTSARQNLERDGFLVSVLFVKLVTNKLLIIEMTELMLAETQQQQCLLMTSLAQRFKRHHQEITEALLLSEGYFVSSQEPGAMQLPPSQHPAGREGCSIFGRNASNTRTTKVVLPVHRNQANRPRLEEKPVIAQYDQPATTGLPMIGLLDYLFPASETH